LSEITETLPHPVLAIPPLVVSNDRDICKKCFELGELVHGQSANGEAAAPSLGVLMRLVALEVCGVGVRVPDDLVCMTDTRTSWDMDHPVKRIGPSGPFLTSPELDNFDVIVGSWGRHIERWLWNLVSGSYLWGYSWYTHREYRKEKRGMKDG